MLEDKLLVKEAHLIVVNIGLSSNTAWIGDKT
jgi:hypothetical protein